MAPCRPHQLQQIFTDSVAEITLRDFLLYLQKSLPGKGRLYRFVFFLRSDPFRHGKFTFIVRITDTHTDHKTVHLSVGKILGSGSAGRILGRYHQKRGWYLPRHAVHRNPPLFHHFQKRRLRFRGCAVDLICQQEVAENAARLIDKPLLLSPVNGKAGQIRWKNIRRELHTFIIQTHCTGKRHRNGCLADAGNVLKKNVSIRQKCGHNFPNLFTFSQNDAVHLFQHLLNRRV